MNHYRLSYAQERAWVDWKKAPDNVAYNNPLQYNLHGDVNIKYLEQAIQYLVAKNAALRTYFIEDQGLPKQVILPGCVAKLDYVDLSAKTHQQQKIAEIVHHNIRRSFNLSELPLFRFSLIKVAEQEFVFILNIHHIVVDGRSVFNVLGDITYAYNAALAGEEVILQSDDQEYIEYLAYEQQFWQQEDTEKYIEHWHNTLKNAHFETRLATRSLAKSHDFQGERHRLSLDQQTSSSLRQIARQNRSTLFLLLLSAFKLLLYRYTGQHDLTVLYPIDIRPKGFKNILGFFVNLVPMRSTVDDNDTFITLLEKVKNRRKQDKPYEELPLQQIIQKVCYSELNGTVNPFNISFISANFALSGLNLNHLRVESTPIFTHAVKDEFSFLYDESCSAIQFEIEYNTHLYPTGVVKQFSAHYLELLKQIAQDPAQLVSYIPYTSTIMQTGRASELPAQRCFYLHFETQALQQPQAIALEFEDQAYTYQVLNEKSNQIGHFLLQKGIKSKDIIGVFLPRSFELVATLLAIQKIGAIYIPLDTHQPNSRIRDIVQTSEMKLLITMGQGAELCEGFDVEFICLTQHHKTILNRPLSNVNIDVNADNLVYIIYTSGTTGVPKGVGIRHYSLTNFLMSMAHQPGITQQDGLLAITTVTFDIAGLELYLPLFVGAKILLTNNWQSKDSSELIKLLTRPDVNLMQATPATWQMLIDSDWQGNNKLKILCGGEALTHKLAEQLIPKCKELWNMYGPTETTIWSTVEKIADPNHISIGTAIDNTSVYILNNQLQPVPFEVIGDIYIGGLGLARGYINNQELTEQVFIENPFCRQEKIYRTGDLGYFLPDHKIKCLGRNDTQVKVRGFRIELSDIEVHLLKIPEIEKAVVLVKEHPDGDKNIIAYLSIQNKNNFSTIDLKSLLKEKLPDYMIPQYFILVDKFPLSGNGKVDKKTLAKLYSLHTGESTDPLEQDITEIEQEVLDIWKSLLNKQAIGINDNFFLLGGHSLLANQCIARLAKTYDTTGLLQQFFEHPTVRSFAKCLTVKSTTKSIQSVSREQTFPLSYAQERIWLDIQTSQDNTRYHMPVGLELKGPLEVEKLMNAIVQVLNRHEIFKIIFDIDHNDDPVQKVKHDITYHPIHLQNASGDMINMFIKEPFNLSTGPLVRILSNTISNEHSSLIFIFHHIIVDGTSVKLFLRDFCKIYNNNEALPILDIQFLDYVHWQKTNSKHLENAKSFWQNILANHRSFQLPTDINRPVFSAHKGQQISILIDASLSQKIKTIALESKVSLFTLMITQFTSFLFCLSKQTQVIVGSAVSGRDIVETEDLIGCFINLLPIRIAFSANDSLKDKLEDLNKYLIKAYAHQHYPFEKMVELVREQSDASRAPVFNILFGLQQDIMNNVHLYNAKTELIILNTQTSKYDMSVDLYEHGDIISGVFEYDTELFHEQTMINIRDKFLTFLNLVTNDINCKLIDLATDLHLPAQLVFSQKDNIKPSANYTLRDDSQLLAIAKKHLKQNQVLLHDNFFNLGGHSLLGVKMVNEMKKQLNLEIPLYLLYKAYDFKEFFDTIQNSDPLMSKPLQPSTQQRPKEMPLSANQQGMIYQLDLTKDKSLYHISFMIELDGILNITALSKALSTLIERHEALRTGFYGVGTQLIAKLLNPTQLQDVLNTVSYNHLSAKDVEQFIQQEVVRPFNLAQPPLVRATLLTNNQSTHRLIFVMHHLIMDEWSVDVYLQEFATLYNIYIKQQSSQLPTCLQYYDFIEWQTAQQATEHWQESLNYWVNQLQDIEPLDLPYSQAKISTTHFEGSCESIPIPASLTEQLKTFSRKTKVSLYVTMLSLFKILLVRLTGQTQICVAGVDNQRHQEALETIVGYLVNVFALSTSFNDKFTVHDTIKAVNHSLTKANQHNPVSFVDIMNTLSQTHPLAFDLIQIMFVLQDPHQLPVFDGMKANLADTLTTSSKYDLTFNLRELANGDIKVSCEYKTNLFHQEIIQNLLRYYLQIIDCCLVNPDANIFELDYLKPADKKEIQLICENNYSFAHQNLISLFNEQVAKHTLKKAIYHHQDSLTYLQLDKLSNQWANYLQPYYINKDTNSECVAVCLDSGIDFVVICLALFKLGLAYIPLDPNDTIERIRYILNDSNTQLIISQKALLSKTSLDQTLCFFLEDHQDQVLTTSDQPLPLVLAPNDLAYIIYTSGTTGQPKGVMLEHQNVVNFIQGLQREISIDSTDRMLQFSSLTFDASVWEIWGSLLSGASLHIPNTTQRLAGRALERFIQLQEISTAILTPTLVMTLDAKQLPLLQKLALGGEALPLSLAQTWAHNRHLYNAYGPTEAAVCSSLSKVEQDPQTIYIGKPLSNVKMFILDSKQQIVPMGVAGELYIGGMGLARGYLHQNELTNKHFVEICIFDNLPQRLYRTFDKVRMLNGKLQFLGRIDRQVKLRGLRIELEAIETKLSQYPGVEKTIVIISTETTPRLLAYLICSTRLEVTQISQYLKNSLPYYMVPEDFIFLDEFPYTHSGKMDLRALPCPEKNTLIIQLPTNPIEQTLYDLWCELLNHEQLSVHDNFFELGGNSLLVMQLLGRIHETLNSEISIKEFFNSPTINSLAQLVEQKFLTPDRLVEEV